jgi:hypothetical protein
MAHHIRLPRASLEANTLIPIRKNDEERQRNMINGLLWGRVNAPDHPVPNLNEIIGLESTMRTLRRSICHPLNVFQRQTLNGKAFLLVGVGTGKQYLVQNIIPQLNGVMIEISLPRLPDVGQTRRYDSIVTAK